MDASVPKDAWLSAVGDLQLTEAGKEKHNDQQQIADNSTTQGQCSSDQVAERVHGLSSASAAFMRAGSWAKKFPW